MQLFVHEFSRRYTLLIVLTLFALVVASHAADQAVGPVRAVNLPGHFNRLSGPQAVVEMPTELLNGDPAAVQVRFSNPPVEIGTMDVSGQTYTAIRMDGEGSTISEGEPDLPRATRLIMISSRGNVDYTITQQRYHIESIDFPPNPYREELPENDRLDDAGSCNPAVYEADAWYPANPVQMSAPVVLRDVRFVVLSVCPVQVNPVTREIRVYDQLDVALNNIGGVGENEIAFTPTSITPGFKALYQSFLNFSDSPLDALPVVPGKHLYICQNNGTVTTQVQRLIDWRRRKGEDAYFRTTATTGVLSTQIRSYIQSEYNASNGQLEFVTMVGDPVASDPYYLTTEENTQFDNYFAALSGGPNPDPMQDLAIGRIPCSSSTNLAAMVNKIILYESDPFLTDTTWFTRGYCLSHTDYAGAPYIPSNPSTKEYTRQIMLQDGLTQVNVDTFPDYLNTTRFVSRVNLGNCVVNHRLCTNQQMVSTDLSGISCGRMNPFMATISCGYGWFTLSGSSTDVTKVYVRMGSPTVPNGCIGCVGMSSTSTWVSQNNIVDAGMMFGLFALHVRHQGLALMSGELQLFRQYWGYGHDDFVNSFTFWTNLMGDPATPIWLEVPHAPQVTKPNVAHVGQNNVAITVMRNAAPVADALVGLVKGAETWARGYTDANGQINLPVTLNSTGYLHVTVTRHNLDSYLDSIQVTQPAATLALFSTTVDDDNLGGTVGDMNGVLNPGETIDLTIRLRNAGNAATATGINATLTSGSAGVSVVSGASAYPNIAVGANQPPTTPFRIQVGAVFDGEPIQLYLTATSSAGTQTARIELTPSAADIWFNLSVFSDGNNRLDAGETGPLSIDIGNVGVRDLVNAQGILRSLNPRITVGDSTGSFGTITASNSGTNAADPFIVTAGALSFGGLEAAMQLVITDANGVRDSVNFVQTVGVAATTSPTGPDPYGYYAYDNTEIQPGGAAATYFWFEIAPPFGGEGFALNLADAVEDSDQVVVQTLPFPFMFYGQTFTQITICTNGWIAFGSYAIDDFRNYRIGSPLGPPFMVCAYWDDLRTRNGVPNGDVYVYSDLVSGRYIVEWVTQTLYTSVDEIFEVVLLDPAQYPTASGNGKILVQYNDCTLDENYTFNDNEWATIGIQNGNHSVGLEYSWFGTYPATAAPVGNGRAIMYTTDPAGTLFNELTVTYPNGGENLLVDSTVTLGWFPATVTGNVNVELSRSGINGPYSLLFFNTANDGLEAWSVSGPTTSTAYIRVVPLSNPTEADTSNLSFSIAQVQNVLAEDFEDGAPNWTHSSAGGGVWVDDWHVSTEQAFSGINSYKCGDPGAGQYRAFNDARLIAPQINNLPPNASLRFYYQIEAELSPAYPDSCYDGGIVELSANGGAYQQIFPDAPYPRTFRHYRGGTTPANGSMPGLHCYSGTVTTWNDVLFNLSAFAGQTIQLRWRFGSDSLNYREGWYVDNVSVFAPVVILPDPTVPINVTVNYNAGVLTLSWLDDANLFYRVYSADTPGGTATLLNTVSTTSYVIPAGPAAVRKFYTVTGWNGQP
jgi:hypothetical protein